jgi:pilus assembly protein CpaE
MSAAPEPEPQPIVACTISRDVQEFALLIEDMEAALGETWGDLTFTEALTFFDQPDSASLVFVAVAIDAEDEADLSLIKQTVAAAKAQGIKVILITEDVSPAALHQLLREGGDEFIPYPLPEGELARAIERVTAPPQVEPPPPPAAIKPAAKARDDRSGVVIPVYGMAGGTGASTFAVNLAWELCLLDKNDPPRVCLIDLGLQFGGVASYLDVPRRDAVIELLSDTATMDSEAFLQSLQTYGDKLEVLTAPGDLVPLDLINARDVERIVEVARTNFDYVVIDMPLAVVEWSEAVLNAAHICFAIMTLDMRCAQNTVRLMRALQAEALPFDKYRFILNRAPGFTDLASRSRIKRMAETLGIAIELQLPDGGKAVAMNGDQGIPMGEGIPRNPLRKEIAKLAKSVHDVNTAEAEPNRQKSRARS